jgi:hypothetical protein
MNRKPLSAKAYGHIPHLPGSRMGPGDHTCNEGHAVIATSKQRDRYDDVIVTVKLDGSCMAVLRLDGAILPLMRAGYLATTSKHEQHHLFAQWVYENQQRFLDVLDDGERFVGEWLAQAHGTRYALPHEPFVPFDVMVGPDRLPAAAIIHKATRAALPSPYRISSGEPFSVEKAIEAIATPRHGELDPVEGAVWRVERHGEFDFICKWVRPDKMDGKFIPEFSGGDAIWNWRPDPKPPGLS